MKANLSRFDSLVDRYYPAVYSFAAKLTDDPREAIELARRAFQITRKQLASLRDQNAVVAACLRPLFEQG